MCILNFKVFYYSIRPAHNALLHHEQCLHKSHNCLAKLKNSITIHTPVTVLMLPLYTIWYGSAI